MPERSGADVPFSSIGVGEYVLRVDWTGKQWLSERSDDLCSGHAATQGGNTLPGWPAGLSSRVPPRRQRDLAGKEEHNDHELPDDAAPLPCVSQDAHDRSTRFPHCSRISPHNVQSSGTRGW